MTLLSRGLAAPLITFGHDGRAGRLAQEHFLLTRSLYNYASTQSVVVPLGADPLVDQLASAKGFSKFDLAILRAVAKGTFFTIVGVPTRIWRDAQSRSILLDMKAEASACGTKCVLIPQRCIRTGVRAQVAKTLAMSNRVRIRREHAKAVKQHVYAMRVSSVAACASQVIGHEDPVGVVLALCARGQLLIDRTKPIGLGSWVATKEEVTGGKTSPGVAEPQG